MPIFLVCGEPLIERVLGRLAPVAGELVVTTSRPSELAYLEERAFGDLVPRVVADLEGSAGAMRGIASSLAAARLPLAAIVACDMPFVSLAGDRQRIRCLIDRVNAGYMDELQIVAVAGSTLCFENVNTPEEFAAAELLA